MDQRARAGETRLPNVKKIETVRLNRRTFVLMAPFALAACQSAPQKAGLADQPELPYGEQNYALMYAPVKDNGFPLPAINFKTFDPQYLRQVVRYSRKYEPGVVVVDPYNKFLYWTLPDGYAIRYGIGVGRAGFAWNGEATIRYKRVWPKWFPPDEMIERQPELEKYREGQDGGPSNPIGSRGLYLWQNNKDTLYRIHGTNQPSSIGTNASSGCIRLWQQDIIDLYERVPLNSKVVVLA